MAVIRRIEATQGIDVGGIPSTRVDDSVGQALQGLGNVVQRAGAEFADIDARRQQMAMQMEEFRSDQEFRRFGDDMSLEYSKAKQNIDPSGQGFTEVVSGDFNKRAEAFLKTVPDALKPKFAELVKTSRETWVNNAAADEVDQRNVWYRDGITKSQEKLQNQVFNDPSVFDAAKQDGLRAIDSSGLPEVEKQKLREAWDQTLSLTVGEREVRDAGENPATAANAARRLGVKGVSGSPVDQFVDRIIGAESGGNPNAKNPNSSASGVGQFLDSTWVATVRAHRPDIAQGKSAAQILALKSDPVLGREMTKAYAQDNADFLTNQGLQATPGNIYLAHFLGPRGAAEVLKADKSASIGAIVGGDVVRANPFLAGKTVGDTVAWANKKMGRSSTEGMDQRYAGLSLDKRLEILDRMNAAAKAGQTRIDAEYKAAYDQHKGAMDLGIQTGQVASERTILSDPTLKDDDKATLLRSLRTYQGDTANVANLVSALAAGDKAAELNPFNSDDRRLGDKAWDQIDRAAPPEQKQAVAESFVAGTGFVPSAVVAGVRQGLNATNVPEVSKGLEQAARLYQIAPQALDAVDNGKELKDAALAYREYTDSRGLSKEQAAKRYMDLHSPEMIERRERLKKPADDFVKTLSTADVTSALNPSYFSFRPSAGLTPEMETALLADYTEIAREKFLETGGDADLAKKLAVQEVAGDGNRPGLYGVSEVSGSKSVMKFPPERYYPPANGGWSYIREAALADAKSVGGDNVGNVFLTPTKETAEDIRANRLPRYLLYYQDQQGVWNRVDGQLFTVAPEQVKGALDADRAARMKAADAARENAIRTREADQAAQKAMETTVGPDWMKANAANAAREQRLMQPTPSETQTQQDIRSKADELKQQRDQLIQQGAPIMQSPF